MTAEPLALASLAGLLLVKEAGVPVPVPGDLLVLGAGVAAAHGELEPGVGLVALIVASIAGGAIQFALLRSTARPLLVRLLARIGIGADRIESQSDRLRRAGARGIAVARMTPGIRIVTIPAGALADVPARAFVAGLAAGNALFIAAHFGLGFILGEPVIALAGNALGPLAAGALVLALLGLVAWRAIGRRRAATGTPLVAWADAACPACLALAVVER
ncbi:MAG TPA: hypothetical protein VIV06_11975 [Candidatus Limnocylindrales bacterium]